jgi:flagellar hook-basal body complex protein FliE
MVGLDKAAGALAGTAVPVWGKADGSSAASTATPFAGIVHSLLDQTQTLGKQASDAVTGLLSGQGVEIHDVMIAQQKASVAFELALQVRNKAVSAYQQMMGMQF